MSVTIALRSSDAGLQDLLAAEGQQLAGQRRRALAGLLRSRSSDPRAGIAGRPVVRAGIRCSRRSTVSRLLKSCATPPASRPTASIFCAWRNWASSCLCSVMSSLMARKWVTVPPILVIGEIDAVPNIIPRSFSGCETPPATARRLDGPPQLLVTGLRLPGGLSIRGFLPRTSEMVYPVTWLNLGLTYSMSPDKSVITTMAGLCSTAWESLRNRASVCFGSVMSRNVQMRPYCRPCGPCHGRRIPVQHVPSFVRFIPADFFRMGVQMFILQKCLGSRTWSNTYCISVSSSRPRRRAAAGATIPPSAHSGPISGHADPPRDAVNAGVHLGFQQGRFPAQFLLRAPAAGLPGGFFEGAEHAGTSRRSRSLST